MKVQFTLQIVLHPLRMLNVVVYVALEAEGVHLLRGELSEESKQRINTYLLRIQRGRGYPFDVRPEPCRNSDASTKGLRRIINPVIENVGQQRPAPVGTVSPSIPEA